MRERRGDLGSRGRGAAGCGRTIWYDQYELASHSIFCKGNGACPNRLDVLPGKRRHQLTQGYGAKLRRRALQQRGEAPGGKGRNNEAGGHQVEWSWETEEFTGGPCSGREGELEENEKID